ncbi:nitrogenase component 1 [Azospirillum soli]|uniref:nitrogenase component 1 n=1 Tax=Azospirillum soli TaxID=1304799 RepID=UPI001AEAA292|nr:nitrogenase component 1 [Azospirillum soli]MBP2316504.1 nitrogenase molybdenum-iron protein beta chain [Azospirillum soli]
MDGILDTAPAAEGVSGPCMVDPVTKCAIFGIAQVVGEIRGGTVLVHGPKGCAFPAFEATHLSQVRFNYSEMCEKTVIFGGETLLREKLWETYHDNDTLLMGVISTCSSEIIGDDIEGVIASAGLPVPVLKFEGAGFKRTHRQAIDNAMAVLLKRFLRAREGSDGSINLLCHVGAHSRWKDDCVELAALLRRFGRPVRPLFLDNDLSDLAAAAAADLTVLASPDVGDEAARVLKRKAKIPYIAPPPPIGLERTADWLMAVAGALGDPLSRDEVDALADASRRRFWTGLGRVSSQRPFEHLRTARIAVVAEPAAAEAYAHLLTRELEGTPSLVIFKTTTPDDPEERALADKLPATSRVVVTGDNARIEAELRAACPDILLGSDLDFIKHQGAGRVAYVGVSYPSTRRVYLNPRSYWGFDGALNFVEDLFNAVTDAHG